MWADRCPYGDTPVLGAVTRILQLVFVPPETAPVGDTRERLEPPLVEFVGYTPTTAPSSGASRSTPMA